ncbi:MAG: hypothetical protein JKX81_05645 [Arenicella sp.]|nr:hypothetical protein [Arenicella sp.]
MSFLKHLILLAFLILPIVANAEHHGKNQKLGPPSDDAKGMDGAKGTFALYPETSYWLDTDGVAPGVAGCHYSIDVISEKPNGRAFAEGCRDDGLLIESNPKKGKVHAHKKDTGHPDLFDCNKWRKGKGHESGKCAVVPAPAPCNDVDPNMTSAICACE